MADTAEVTTNPTPSVADTTAGNKDGEGATVQSGASVNTLLKPLEDDPTPTFSNGTTSASYAPNTAPPLSLSLLYAY